MYKTHKGKGEIDTTKHAAAEEKPSPWENDPDITGEYKIDIGSPASPDRGVLHQRADPRRRLCPRSEVGREDNGGVHVDLSSHRIFEAEVDHSAALRPRGMGDQHRRKNRRAEAFSSGRVDRRQATEGSFPSSGAASKTAELETEESDMTVDLALEARRLNAIGDPLLYRIRRRWPNLALWPRGRAASLYLRSRARRRCVDRNGVGLASAAASSL